MTFRKNRLYAAALAAAAAIALAHPAAAKKPPLALCVDPAGANGCSTTIQGAVNQVPAHGNAIITIAASNAPYMENISVSNLNVSFVGAGPGLTVVDGSGGSALATFSFANNSSAELHQMTIQNGTGATGSNIHFRQLNAKNKGVGTLRIQNCEITGGSHPNSTVANGAVDFFGARLIIDSSSVTGNHDRGISVARGTVTITNSTISENDSPGSASQLTGCGLLVGAGCSASLNNVTVTGNICDPHNALSQGGGLFLDSGLKRFTMSNTVVAGNSAPLGPDCVSNGRLKSKGWNLVENTSDCSFKAAKTDIAAGTDPQLAALAACPSSALEVQTPQPGSPLIGKGNPGSLTGGVGFASTHCLPVDECGSARSKGNCSIGAVE